MLTAAALRWISQHRDHTGIAAPEGITEALGAEPVAVLHSADLIAVLASPEAVRDLKPDIARIAALPGGAVIVTAQGGDNADITSRYFAPAYGIAEDPVTGSLHTQVVPYWAARLGRHTLTCHQASARGGVLHCEYRAPRVRMSGTAVLYASGTMNVPD
jgi:predicted PhzF superfamily epimerase YddE/YHI9